MIVSLGRYEKEKKIKGIKIISVLFKKEEVKLLLVEDNITAYIENFIEFINMEVSIYAIKL